MSTPTTPRRRFDAARLARLMEITSSVKCECPNHLAKIVEALVSFEDYSRACESQSRDDALVHAMLARETGRAREVMEAALVALLEFEKIEL